MPHPADHPAAALAITRGLTGQLQKARQNGDTASAAAIEAALLRARRIVAAGNAPPQPRQDRPPAPPQPTPQDEGWAEIVMDRRRQHRRW